MFQVERWGGQRNKPARVVFIGSEDKARAKYAKIAEALRQGTVRLYDDGGTVVKQDFGPSLRTRW